MRPHIETLSMYEKKNLSVRKEITLSKGNYICLIHSKPILKYVIFFPLENLPLKNTF